MIALPTAAGIFLYSKPTDMGKSFSGLAGIVRNKLGKTPHDGSLKSLGQSLRRSFAGKC